MSDANSEIKALQARWKDAELVGEGEHSFALLPTLKVVVNGAPKIVKGLIQPWPSAGYSTRVYFSEKFTDKGSNWGVFNLLGSTWHTHSWNHVPADIPWIEILAGHLGPLQ